MVQVKSLRSRTNCRACGQPVVVATTVLASTRNITFRSTEHVTQVEDPALRCKYDGGPGDGSRARQLEQYPGDTRQ